MRTDLIYNFRSREWMTITALPGSTHIGVTRGQRDSPQAAVASGDLLIGWRLITVDNRGVVNHDAILARDMGPGQAGVFVEPPGTMQVTS